VTKKIETGTIQEMREMNIIERESIILMIEVVACLLLKILIMIKGSLFPETNLLNFQKEKLTS
jgi:hypothetical protein